MMREHGRALFLPSPLVREVTSYPLPAELGFIRVLPFITWSKSETSDFDWERVASASDSKREPGEGENA